MTDIEDKIRDLLALASHPNTPVEEARTAAHNAARLMREHKIEVGGGSVPEPFPFAGVASSQASSRAIVGQAMHTFIEFLLDLQKRREAAPPPPPPPPAPRTPFDELFWDRWTKEHPTPAKPKKKRRRSKQARKNNPNRERKRSR